MLLSVKRDTVRPVTENQTYQGEPMARTYRNSDSSFLSRKDRVAQERSFRDLRRSSAARFLPSVEASQWKDSDSFSEDVDFESPEW